MVPLSRLKASSATWSSMDAQLENETFRGATFLLRCKENLCSSDPKTGSSCDEDASVRRERQLTPNEKKDEFYWARRRKNNEAARRSREKRRANGQVLERRILSLLQDNASLRAELLALKFRFGLVKGTPEGLLSPLPIHTQPQTFNALRGSSPVDEEALSVTEQEDVTTPPEVHGRLRSLPHKLRFKAPGGDVSSCSSRRQRGPPVATAGPNFQQTGWEAPSDGPREQCPNLTYHSNRGPDCQCQSLQTQLTGLSQEVTQLKRLLSQQLLTKMPSI
ncbi:nuclear factor interleukin-3-regulated protein-like [Synchiropus splendidus]|uniref:nuclear factor interleukin-3-regulated protein-like n=1 Tax=Synchiropus splendidus TaxID=270530 RepID=UPI00237E57EC|nr:nuclear factor interleukin-3-regulated protein-like [Synchiropus splendidus]